MPGVRMKVRPFSLLILLGALAACTAPSLPSDVGNETRASTAGLTLSSGTVQSGFTGDLVTWKDSAAQTRTAFLVAPGADAAGAYGGYLRSFTYGAGTSARSIGPSAGEIGFGLVYAQRSSDYDTVSSRYVLGTRSVTSQGSNHIVIQYVFPVLKTSSGSSSPIKATVQWTFVAGRDYPLFDITYDATSAGVDAIELDTKTPYGGLEFTGMAGTTVDGIGWGDQRKFVTTSAPVTLQSSWDYTVANLVPYVHAWNDAKNAEMGLVQSERTARHDAGYGWFYGNWGHTSANRVVDSGTPGGQIMPANWNWPFLLHQYDLPDTTKKRMGWGMNYGAVGKTSAWKYGYTGSYGAWPYESYGVFLVLGPKASVAAQVVQTERLTGASLTASRGTVVTSGPGGIGRTDSVAYSPAGYNPLYATFDVQAESSNGAVVMSFDPKSTAIANPVFRILGYPLSTDPTGVRLGTTTLVQGTDYEVSRDGATLWFILKRTVTSAVTLGMNEVPPAAPVSWSGVAIDAAQSVGGYVSDVYRWRDSRNKERSAALVRNDALDPAGLYGGYIRRFTYVKNDGTTLTAVGGHKPEHPGFGYTLHHQNGGLDRDTLSSRRAAGTYRQVFVGPHHAMHEYSWNVLRTQGELPAYPQQDKNIKIVIRWLFSTGQDAVTWAHTIDTSGMGPNGFFGDDRSPAGELAFDGVDGPATGVGWGDRYRFKTTSTSLSFASTWDYAQPNRVPYVQMWSDPQNAEMGAAQTWDWQHKDAGQGWLYPNWGRTSANKVVTVGTPTSQTMPVDWNWTYQLNQFELPFDANGKRIAWSTPVGSTGQTSYTAYGDDKTLSGYPYTLRTVRVVLGAKGATNAEVDQVARSLDVVLTAAEGTVVTSGPKGFGGAALVSETFAPAGWDHVYGVFELAASAASAVRFTMSTNDQDLVRPMFRIRNWTGALPGTMRLGTATLAKDVDFFPSVVTNDGQRELWLTLNRTVHGPIELAIGTP